ncbi:MAG: threonine ammonia-lyase [Dehalococcoidia bacterium]|nr:threonine ammonia-lyase [Dehalococcoidia bacterium]
MTDLVTLQDIEAARGRIREQVRVTPLWPTQSLSERLGVPLSLKCENLQRTGSFKPRGALNMIAATPRPAGVVAGSAGNHAQGVALAASMHQLPATVFMPAEAPIAKRLATEGYGAQVELVEGPLSAAIERARAFAEERGHLFMPPFDHRYVVAGQGTVGLEILEQEPEVETLLVPAGGGGLLAGVALAVKALRPEVRVVGVQTRAMPGIVDSHRLGRRTTVPAVRTIADGVGVAGPSELTLSLIERYVDDLVEVPEDAIARAVVLLIERTKLVVEGAGALGVAALLTGVAEARGRTVAVLSGGNIDINLLDRIVERGLLDEGRRQRLTFAAANVPGELARITNALAAGGANIIEVAHELVVPGLPVGVARITVRLDVAGPEGLTRLEVALLEAGLQRAIETDFATDAAAAMPS